MTHSAGVKYGMPLLLIKEIAIIKAVLCDEIIDLETTFSRIVDRNHNLEAGANSCKRAGSGWSIDLDFWGHLKYSAEIQQRARLPNKSIGMDNFLVLLNWCDGTSVCSWVNWK